MPKKLILPGILLILLLLVPTFIRIWAGDKIARELPGIIGPADSYRVSIYSPLWRLVKGKIDRLEINVHRLQIKDNPVIDRLELSCQGVEVDLKSRKIIESQENLFSAQIREKDINKYLDLRQKPFKDAHLELRDGKLFIAGNYPVLLGKLRVKVETALKVAGGERILLNLQKLQVENFQLPAALVHLVEFWANPLVDLSKGELPVKVSELKIESRRLVITGTFQIPR